MMATETMPMYVARRSQDRKAAGKLDLVCSCLLERFGEEVLLSAAQWSRASESLLSKSRCPNHGRSVKIALS